MELWSDVCPQERNQQIQEEEKRKLNVAFAECRLQLRLPSRGEFNGSSDKDEDNDGFRSPTMSSLDRNQIAATLPQCPPPPRKPKALAQQWKRKDGDESRGVLLDVSEEIESMFPPAIQRYFYGKIKKVNVAVAECRLQLKLPSRGEFNGSNGQEEDNDGLRTPTTSSSDRDQITATTLPQCPPPPRKPKAVARQRKRKDGEESRRILLDVSEEIESMFPPAIRRQFHGKIKKVKLSNTTTLC